MNSATPNASMSRLTSSPISRLHFDLDRETVTVPAGLPMDVVAGHRAVSRVHVLERPRESVADVRLRVGRRRAVVEDPLRRALALRERSVEYVGFVPEPQDPTAPAPGSAPWDRPARTRGLRRSPSVVLHDSNASSSPAARTRREPRGTTSLAGRLAATDRSRPRSRPAAVTGGPACASHGPRPAGSGRGSGRMFARRSAPGSHRPRLARALPSPRRVPVVAFRVHATPRGERDGPRRSLDRIGRRWSCRPAGSWSGSAPHRRTGGRRRRSGRRSRRLSAWCRRASPSVEAGDRARRYPRSPV